MGQTDCGLIPSLCGPFRRRRFMRCDVICLATLAEDALASLQADRDHSTVLRSLFVEGILRAQRA